MTSAHKCWVFTLNNWTDQDVQALVGLEEATFRGRSVFRYMKFQKEIGRSGTPHLQGHFVLNKRKRRSMLVRNFTVLGRANLEVRRGSFAEADAYCSKERTRVPDTIPYEWGTPPAHGNRGRQGRNDFTNFLTEVRAGAGWKQLIEMFPNVVGRYHAGARKMYDEFSTHRNGRPSIRIYYGPSGTGKSFTAMKKYPGAYIAPWPTGGRWWWPHYRGEEIVILNEFRHQVKMDVLLQLFDYHPMWIEEKGGNMKLKATKFIVTTNIAPNKWYPKLSVDQAEMLHRRLQEFGKCYEFMMPEGGMQFGDDGLPDPSYTRVDLQDREEPIVINELFDFRRQ